MSKALELRKVVRAKRVLELLASGEASSISEACELANVPRRSFTRYLSQGVCDPLIAAMQRTAQVVVASLIAEAMPAVVQQRIEDAKTAASPRDRDQAARSLGILWAKFCEPIIGEPDTGEAQRWIAANRHRFERGIVAVQVNVNTGKDDDDIVNAEVIENEQEIS